MARLGRRLPRRLGRGLARSRLRGIRFRLGVALALALLPFLIFSTTHTAADFRQQAEARRIDLQLATARAAASTRSRLETTSVLVDALGLEPVGPECASALRLMADRLRIDETVARYSATGQAVCGDASAPDLILAQPWFQRLRAGEDEVFVRAPAGWSDRPALIVARRVQRPLGRFDGAVATLLPLSALQPDLDDAALPEGSQAALTDDQGRILIATEIADFDLLDDRSLVGWVDRARTEARAVFRDVDASGEQRVYSGAALVGRDIYVLLSAPDPGLLSWARLNPISIFLLPLVAWALAFGAVMWVTERMVVRWLAYLKRIAAIYGRGRFSVRPVQAMNGPAEIRTLAVALDRMADAIGARDQSLMDSLEEKDALMREIHHRVKNNLQIISSLLSMQQRALTDEPAKVALGETRQRIAALALIYRTLYQGNEIRHADVHEFLTELVGQLVASEATRGPAVSSSVQADSLLIDPDKLAPLALWVVEAVSNAHKHAFAGRGGTLCVTFRVEAEMSRLEVRDDGPVDDGGGAKPGVGRTLMTAFARQLRGESSMTPAPGGGTIACLRFVTPTCPGSASHATGTAPLR